MTPPRLVLASLCVLLLQSILPSALAQITVGTPPISVGTPPVGVSVPPISVSTPPVSVSVPPVSVSTPPVSVSVPPVSATLSSILGHAVCDKCLDGENFATQDTPLSGVQVSVNCTITNSVTGPTYVAATGTTASDGSFSIGLSAAANAAFLAALYIGGVPTNGALAGAALTSCSLLVDSSDCPIQTLDNGLCLAAGVQGNGETSALSLVNLGTTSADISISGEICTAPLVKDLSCPTVSTPPTSVGTPPVSISTPPISVSTPPISVSTPPISVSTPPISVSTPPISVSTPPVSVSVPPVSVTLSSILGHAVCDKCLDGENSATQDTPLSGVQVSVNCTITNNVTGPTYVAATGTTTSDGSFSIGLSAAANAAFLAALYIGGVPTNGALAGASLTSCSLLVDSSDCPIQTLNNGLCLAAGVQGNGETSALSLVNLGTTSADISISGEICTAPLVKDLSCPTVSTPPTSVGTPPVSISTPPTSVSTPPISVSTPPISVSTPPISVSTPPISVTIPGVTGDPHYTGADGSRFDFSGEPDNSYCLISDSHLHINVFYGGRFDQWGDNPHKALTWIRQMGILWDRHTVTFAARSGARWQYDNGYMARMEIDGQELKLSQEGDSYEHAGGKIKVTWLAAKVQSADDLIDVYELEIEGVLKMRINLRPEIELLRTKTDGLVHIDFDLPVASLSNEAHGILGQTFRRDHTDRLSHQKLEFSELFHALVVPGDNAEGFIDGSMADYRSSGLLGSDCRFSRFTGAASRDATVQEALELTATRGQNIIGKTATIGRKMGRIQALPVA